MSFISKVQATVHSAGKVLKRSFGPLSPLDVDNITTDSVFRYPLNVGEYRQFPHTVEFQTWIPDPKPLDQAAVDGFNKTIQGFGNTPSGLTRSTNEIPGLEDIEITARKITNDGREVDTMRVNQNQQYNSRLIDYTRRANPSDLIVMYLPAGAWNDQIQNQYTEASMTAALGNLGLGIEAGGKFMKAFETSEGDLLDRVWSGMKAAGTSPVAAEAGIRVMGGALQNLGIVGDAGVLADAALNSLGYAVNPQLEMLYAGTSMREFQFDFTMTPRNKKEAEEIMMIVRKFKYHASPQYTENHGRYIIPPSFFDITFKFNGSDSEYLPRISTCALRAVDINYSGGLDQWATFEDGMPIQIQMVLRFVELEMMHKRLREEGY